MSALGLRSLLSRRTAFTATAVSACLGASQLTLTVRRRAEEFALLRTVGASRWQVRRLVPTEAVSVALAAGAIGVLPGWWVAGAVLDLLQSAGLVDTGLPLRPGPLPVAATLAIVLLASAVAALAATRSATTGPPQQALVAAASPHAPARRWRLPVTSVLLADGAVNSVLTATVMADSADPYAPMTTAGPAAVLWSVGLALLAPELLRLAATVAATIRPGGRTRVTTALALSSARARPRGLAGVLTPVLVFVGTAAGTLSLTLIDAGVPPGDDGDRGGARRRDRPAGRRRRLRGRGRPLQPRRVGPVASSCGNRRAPPRGRRCGCRPRPRDDGGCDAFRDDGAGAPSAPVRLRSRSAVLQ